MALDNNVIPIMESETPTPSGEASAPNKGRGERKKKDEKPIDWGRFNELVTNFVLIYGTDTCYDLRTRLLLKVNHLRLAFGSDYVKMWLGSDQRRMILPDQLVFDPADKVDEPCINLFDGFVMQPKAGDFEPILELLYHLCADSADSNGDVSAVVAWVLKWLALPLQKPGTKMRSALIFHGLQGAGKNLFFELVASIYGRYASVIGQDQLEDKFNDWASQKMLLIGDEVVARQELFHQKNKLKAFITGETIQINTKMMPLRQERNFANVVFLSNEDKPVALEESDRRYFVVYTPPRRDDDIYVRVAACMASGGVEAFYDFLLRYDLTGFSNYDIPPMTRAKHNLIMLCLKPEDRFVREWLMGVLPLPLQVCSASQLYRAFKRWCQATGERFFPPQEGFTRSAKRMIDSMSRKNGTALALNYKVVKLIDSVNGQRAQRMWIPDGCTPPGGQTEGEWACEGVTLFEEALRTFMEQHGAAS
ncbi:primase-helicase family protein [Malikia spinosa]|uniref:primase-helicase family protein n=1 Tax=Malikia spinosa TaxID=86180 RepID=UPI002FDB18A6